MNAADEATPTRLVQPHYARSAPTILLNADALFLACCLRATHELSSASKKSLSTSNPRDNRFRVTAVEQWDIAVAVEERK